MKQLSFMFAGVLVLGASLTAGMAHAQVAYTNSALNGCYGHLSTSVDSGNVAQDRDVVGTMCFDGKGHIVGAAKSPHMTGAITNTDGTVRVSDDHTGTYMVTNSPGDGMGVFEGKCGKHAFVIHNLDTNGLARGFSYALIERKKDCKDTGPVVIGGTAQYQGPLQ